MKAERQFDEAARCGRADTPPVDGGG